MPGAGYGIMTSLLREVKGIGYGENGKFGFVFGTETDGAWGQAE